jgi:hypothetical protein
MERLNGLVKKRLDISPKNRSRHYHWIAAREEDVVDLGVLDNIIPQSVAFGRFHLLV